MKKNWAISFATFYLLLSTGLYVCILHCAGENLFKPKEREVYSKAGKSHEDEKAPCSKDKDCKCCSKHGQYVISENVKTTSSLLFAEVAVLNVQNSFNELFISQVEVNSVSWPKGNAPPGRQKIPLYISNRTLLI